MSPGARRYLLALVLMQHTAGALHAAITPGIDVLDPARNIGQVLGSLLIAVVVWAFDRREQRRRR